MRRCIVCLLFAQVSPKNVFLPINDVTLTVLVKPEAPSAHPYKYEWKWKVDGAGKEGDGKASFVVNGSSMEKELKISGLTEGTYKFNVTVTNTNPCLSVPRGKAVGVVTVFPRKKF